MVTDACVIREEALILFLTFSEKSVLSVSYHADRRALQDDIPKARLNQEKKRS